VKHREKNLTKDRLAKRIAAIESTIDRYLKELDRADRVASSNLDAEVAPTVLSIFGGPSKRWTARNKIACPAVDQNYPSCCATRAHRAYSDRVRCYPHSPTSRTMMRSASCKVLAQHPIDGIVPGWAVTPRPRERPRRGAGVRTRRIVPSKTPMG
jgi:hypothetical protein